MAVLTGLPSVLARLDTAASAMAGPAAEATAKQLADSVVTKAKSMAPVRTGALRESIEATASGNGAVVVASARHAAAVEFGTSDTDAQSFLRPALHQTEAEIRPTARSIFRTTVPGLK